MEELNTLLKIELVGQEATRLVEILFIVRLIKAMVIIQQKPTLGLFLLLFLVVVVVILLLLCRLVGQTGLVVHLILIVSQCLTPLYLLILLHIIHMVVLIMVALLIKVLLVLKGAVFK